MAELAVEYEVGEATIWRPAAGLTISIPVSTGRHLRRPLACLLVATADPADRTVVALDRDGAASAISAIISVGAISGSLVVSGVTRLRAHSYAPEWRINGNLS
jgi:hypothetical protein